MQIESINIGFWGKLQAQQTNNSDIQQTSDASAISGNIQNKDSFVASSETEQTYQNPTNSSKKTSDKPKQLSEAAQKQVDNLKDIDQKVRQHEAAHQASSGGLAGAATFQYATGPDGKKYAVGGEVNIDTSAVPNDPEATIRKLQQVQRSALAPSDPSPQDLRVAEQANKSEAQARTAASEQSKITNNPTAVKQDTKTTDFGKSQDSTSAPLRSPQFPAVSSGKSNLHSPSCGCLACSYTSNSRSYSNFSATA